MDKFILKHQYIDDRSGKITSETCTEFDGVCLYDESVIGILTRMEMFLHGAGFEFDGHLTIVEEE